MNKVSYIIGFVIYINENITKHRHAKSLKWTEKEAKMTPPFIMKPTLLLELEERIPLDDSYNQEEVVAGYEATQPENLLLQLVMKEQMEWLLDNNSFFSDD
jgi:hypothetical protein